MREKRDLASSHWDKGGRVGGCQGARDSPVKNIVTDCDFEDYDFEGDMSRNFFFSLSQKVGECCVSKGQGMIEGGLHMRRRRRRLLRWPKEEEAGVGRPYVRKVAGWGGTD